MVRIRRRLSWLICGWLAVQLAGAVAAPLAFRCQDAQAAGDLPACCKALAPGQTCPMHHHQHEHDRTCKMRSVCGRADAALVTLTGGLGILPPPTIRVTAFVPGESIAWSDAVAPLCDPRPDSPPPRG